MVKEWWKALGWWQALGFTLLLLNMGLMGLCAYLFVQPDSPLFIKVEAYLVGSIGLWNFVRITVALEKDKREF